MVVNNFKWIEPSKIKNSPRVQTKYEQVNRKQRVAAIDIKTDQIVYIFDNVIAAARAILQLDYNDIKHDNDTIRYAASKIGKAINSYHKECLNYYWKYIY